MTRFEHSITIRRPLEEVWAFVNDPANDPTWQGPTLEVRGDFLAPVEVGDEFVMVSQYLGLRIETTFVVTEYEPMSRSSVRAVSGPVPATATYTFESVEGGTRFTMLGETDAHGLFKLAEPVFARMARREWASSGETLKELLEAGVAAAVP
jgi:ligand-binding SRPBCC domain-containing protein